MKFLKATLQLSLAAALCLGVTACSDDGGSTPNPNLTGTGTTPSGVPTNLPTTPGTNTGNTGTDNTGTGVWQCDPVGMNPEMGGLLNAEPKAGVQVVTKVPNHPGNPGPTGLPQ